MARARGSNATCRAAYESVYGTAPASGAYTQLPFVSSNLGAEQPLEASDLLGMGRAPQDPDLGMVVNDGDLVVPVDARNFGFWLKAGLGAPVTTEDDGVFTHVYTSGKTVLPSLSIEIGFPDVPSYGTNVGALLNTIAIALATSGKLNATLGFICQNETLGTVTKDNASDVFETVRFPQFVGAIKRNGVALGQITSASFNFSNNYEKVEVINPAGTIAGGDAGVESCTGDIASRFADTTLLDQATSQEPCEIEFAWSRGDWSLKIEIDRVFLPRAKRPVNGPQGVQATFNYQAAVSSGSVIKVTLVNDVAAYT